jgi:hypothetical protein
MAQAIRELKKLGARNKAINDSVNEIMTEIYKMRQERLAKELANRKHTIATKNLAIA